MGRDDSGGATSDAPDLELLATAHSGGGSLTEWATHELPTRHGPARVTSFHQSHPHGHVVLLHGAGTGTDAPALVGIGKAMLERGWDVALIEQPYRVEGRRAPAPAVQLDEVVRTVVTTMFAGRRDPLVFVGRSSGARVGCRLATELGASLVVALGFPLEPPSGRASRQPELDAAGVPVFIVQGTKDTFGMPRRDARKGREVYRVEGADHALERSRTAEDPLEAIVLAVAERLDELAR